MHEVDFERLESSNALTSPPRCHYDICLGTDFGIKSAPSPRHRSFCFEPLFPFYSSSQHTLRARKNTLAKYIFTYPIPPSSRARERKRGAKTYHKETENTYPDSPSN